MALSHVLEAGAAAMIDVLYRVKGGVSNEELRYSLRSLANIEHGEVFMVGAPPAWVRNVTIMPGKQYRTKWEALLGDLLLACDELKGRDLLLMDDDFYLMRPQSIVPMHRGLLSTHISLTQGSYKRSLKMTLAYLAAKGIEAPLSYDLHAPMPIQADAMAEAIRPAAGQPLQPRTLYGNLSGVEAQLANDVKVTPGKPMPSGALLSTRGKVLPVLWRTFPKASRYEN